MKYIKHGQGFTAALTVMVLFLALSCSPRTIEPKPIAEPILVVPVPIESMWDKLVTNAKREGRLIIDISTPGSATSQFISKTFKEKFGIDVELSGLPSAVSQEKILRERKAGIFNLDINLSSMGTSFLFYKKIEFPDVLDRVVFLPEVADNKVWIDGSVFLDKNHTAAGGFAGVNCLLFVNSQLVKPGEIKSLDDLLLDPDGKEKYL